MGLEKVKISLDYLAVMHHAEDMEDEADKLQKRIRDLRNVYNDLKTNWEGPAATTYLNKLRLLINNMTTTYNNMNSVVGTIRRTAKTIKEADEKAAENSSKL